MPQFDPRHYGPQHPPPRPIAPPTVSAPSRFHAEMQGPHRDFTVSPSDSPFAAARIETMNQDRAKVSLPPIQVNVTRQRQQDPSDPIFVLETATIRVQGASQEELDRISIGNVRTEPERKVNAGDVMSAAVVAHRLNGKVYVGRGQGENSLPDQVDRYIVEGPNGPMRQRLAPTQADKDEAGRVRIWVRSQHPTTDYQPAVRHALTTEYRDWCKDW